MRLYIVQVMKIRENLKHNPDQKYRRKLTKKKWKEGCDEAMESNRMRHGRLVEIARGSPNLFRRPSDKVFEHKIRAIHKHRKLHSFDP